MGSAILFCTGRGRLTGLRCTQRSIEGDWSLPSTRALHPYFVPSMCSDVLNIKAESFLPLTDGNLDQTFGPPILLSTLNGAAHLNMH